MFAYVWRQRRELRPFSLHCPVKNPPVTANMPTADAASGRARERQGNPWRGLNGWIEVEIHVREVCNPMEAGWASLMPNMESTVCALHWPWRWQRRVHIVAKTRKLVCIVWFGHYPVADRAGASGRDGRGDESEAVVRITRHPAQG